MGARHDVEVRGDRDATDSETAATTLVDAPPELSRLDDSRDDTIDDVVGSESRRRSGWTDLPLGDIAVLVLAAALPVFILSNVKHFFATPKTAILWLAIGPGLVALVRLIRRRDRAAYFGAAFVVVALVSAALSASFVLALVGDASQQTGALFLMALVALWALGRTLTPAARRYLVNALVIGVLANAVFLWIQNIFSLPAGSIFSPGGRPEGFLGNPVYVGGLCAAGVALAGAKAARVRVRADAAGARFGDFSSPWLWAWLAGLFVLGGAVQISGGRAAVAVAFSGGVWLVWRYRRRSVAVVAALVIGLVVSTVVPESPTAVGRLASEPAKDVNVRFDVWWSGAEALAERPVFGWGPGRFLQAAAPHRTLTIAAPTPRGIFADAHNFVVEIAVTTGIVGVLVVAAWLFLSGRSARGPLAAFAALIAVYSLVEPLSVGVTPLALLALGAADTRQRDTRPWGLGWRILVLVTVLIALFGSVRLLIGEMRVKQAIDETREGGLDLEAQQRGQQLLPPWTRVALEGGTMRSLVAAAEPEQRDQIYAYYEDLIERDPEDFRIYESLAWRELVWGRPEQAAANYARALERNPWSPIALDERAAALRELGRDAEAEPLCERLAAFGDPSLARYGCIGPQAYASPDQPDYDDLLAAMDERLEVVGVPAEYRKCAVDGVLDEMTKNEAAQYAINGVVGFRVQTVLHDVFGECIPGFG